MWVIIDVNTRRPMPLKRAELDVPEACPPSITAEPLQFPEDVEELGVAHLVTSRRDVDFNGHINNSAYLTWAIDTMPNPPGCAPRRIHVAYKHESMMGEPLCIVHRASGMLSQHRIEGGGKLRAVITMEWAK